MSIPSENTLTVNATHQMLSDLEGPFETLSVLSPSRRMENVLGYDVNLPRLKAVVFQYKRPYTVMSDTSRRFQTNQDQWRTLISLCDEGEAFFTFPEIVDVVDLEESLERTVFIDVHGIQRDTSLVYIPRDACIKGRPSGIGAKIRGGPRYRVPDRYVYNWSDLRRGVERCNIGLRIKENEDITSGFGRFRNRVMRLVEGDIDWVVDRIREVAEYQNTYDNYSDEDNLYETRQRLNRLYEEGADLSTYGIGRSRHAMLGSEFSSD